MTVETHPEAEGHRRGNPGGHRKLGSGRSTSKPTQTKANHQATQLQGIALRLHLTAPRHCLSHRQTAMAVANASGATTRPR